MKRYLLSVILGAAAFLNGDQVILFAQETPHHLLIEADYAAFKIPDDTSGAYVEIYYNLHREQLKYHPIDSGYVAFVDFHISVKDTADNILDSLSWRAGNWIAKLSALDKAGYLITDMIADFIPAGSYRVDLEAYHGDLFGRATFAMTVPKFKGRGPEVSSIELAYDIKPDTGGQFYKNGIRVLPNPSGQFYQDNNKANIYAEAYGLDVSATADSVFLVSLDFLTGDSLIIESVPRIQYLKPGKSAVITSKLPLDSIPAGNYILRMTINDGGQVISTAKNISVTISRDNLKRAVLQGIMKDFPEANSIISDKDAAKFRDEIVYIATQDELKLYDSLNLTGKAAFQKDFWARRDPDASTEINEYEIEHYKRYKYVESTYGRFQGSHPGWRTDRGRVYMIYGEPSEIERYPQAIDARSWERWWYHGLEGGVYFIFVDFEDGGDYTLLHSSKRDEIKNYNWEDRIKVNVIDR